MPANELLTRAVAEVVPKDLAEKKLKIKKPLRVYWGIDPTGTKIHLGHSIPLRKLQQFADAGHHAILLIGSFTAMLGDPSDKDAMRKPLTREQIEKNFQTYKEQAAKILDFGKIEIVHNHEWLEKLSFEEVLKLASHFTVQQMLQREKFKKRLKEDQQIGVHEFFYPFMQGYDSVQLDVDCEIGGTDQLFNMLAGRTLQQAYGKREKFVLTTPLIEGIDGRLMSKTYDNCIWLEDPPNEMYGKIMSMKDELILTYMECCTDIPMSEIAEVENAMRKGENPKEFKMRLAREIVTLYHSADAAAQAEEEFQRVFKEHGLPDEVPEATVKKGTLLIDVITEHGLAPSKSEARRLIQQGGVSVNDTVVESVEAEADEGIVKVGKRKFLRVKVE